MLNTAIGGTANDIYLIVTDLGSNSGQGFDFINGFTFLYVFPWITAVIWDSCWLTWRWVLRATVSASIAFTTMRIPELALRPRRWVTFFPLHYHQMPPETQLPTSFSTPTPRRTEPEHHHQIKTPHLVTLSFKLRSRRSPDNLYGWGFMSGHKIDDLWPLASGKIIQHQLLSIWCPARWSSLKEIVNNR